MGLTAWSSEIEEGGQKIKERLSKNCRGVPMILYILRWISPPLDGPGIGANSDLVKLFISGVAVSRIWDISTFLYITRSWLASASIVNFCCLLKLRLWMRLNSSPESLTSSAIPYSGEGLISLENEALQFADSVLCKVMESRYLPHPWGIKSTWLPKIWQLRPSRDSDYPQIYWYVIAWSGDEAPCLPPQCSLLAGNSLQLLYKIRHMTASLHHI